MDDETRGRGFAPAQSTTVQDFARLNLVGNSDAFRSALRLIERVSQCDANVLIEGETGTGKELAARAIHYLGARHSAPFIPVNCGAIPDTLVENELFGHVRGAFTDAKEARAGVISQAQGGTLFLDEVDALSARSQVALLRFLQDREFKPVGGPVIRNADVRVIASSNADLEDAASRGVFRSDLLFRLNVLSVPLPPLRQRLGDPRLLAEMFLLRFSRQYRIPARTLHPDTLAFLDRHSWPGNVRELENLMHRAFLMSDGPTIQVTGKRTDRCVAENSEASMTSLRFQAAKARAIAQFERAYIVELLSRTRGNISLAARISGKERSRLGKLVKKYGLQRASFAGEFKPV